MGLIDAFEQAAENAQRLGDVLRAITAEPIRAEITTTAGAVSDHTEAEAIKRGQKPETLEALRRALEL